MNELGRFRSGARRVVIDGARGLFLDERDVSELAQAKGANAAGLRIVLGALGVAAADLDVLYLAGGFGYGEVKQELFQVLDRRFGEARTRYDAFVKDRAYLEKMLLEGSEKARAIGAPLMRKVRKAVGVRYNR